MCLPETGTRLKRGSHEGALVPCLPITALDLEDQRTLLIFPYSHNIPILSLFLTFHIQLIRNSCQFYLTKASYFCPLLFVIMTVDFLTLPLLVSSTLPKVPSSWYLPFLFTLQSAAQVISLECRSEQRPAT